MGRIDPSPPNFISANKAMCFRVCWGELQSISWTSARLILKAHRREYLSKLTFQYSILILLRKYLGSAFIDKINAFIRVWFKTPHPFCLVRLEWKKGYEKASPHQILGLLVLDFPDCKINFCCLLVTQLMVLCYGSPNGLRPIPMDFSQVPLFDSCGFILNFPESYISLWVFHTHNQSC